MTTPIVPPYKPGNFAKQYATPEGQKAWDVLTTESNIARMETASDLGVPALKPLEDTLLHELGDAVLGDRMKQMIGNMVGQIMTSRGFVHDTGDIKLASVPFYKASRYHRSDRTSLYLFKSSKNPRQIILTNTRDASNLPTSPDGGKWQFVNTISSRIKAAVGYQLDLKAAAKEVAAKGYFLHQYERMLRAG